MGRCKIGGADVDITHFIKTCLHCLEVLYLYYTFILFYIFIKIYVLYISHLILIFCKFKTRPELTIRTFCCIYLFIYLFIYLIKNVASRSWKSQGRDCLLELLAGTHVCHKLCMNAFLYVCIEMAIH